MRDPERIDDIIDRLRLAWHRVPDWRFGQLVSNLLGTGIQDVFFPEDDVWSERLDYFMDKGYKEDKDDA